MRKSPATRPGCAAAYKTARSAPKDQPIMSGRSPTTWSMMASRSLWKPSNEVSYAFVDAP